jgi:TolB-like protein
MTGLFAELRKRNVLRVAAAYCVVGWLVAQVADLAADNFGAPEWVMRMLLIVLLLGLPVALFLAWAFELTPEGVKRAAEVPADAPKDPRSGRILNRIIIATLLLAVAGLIWDRVRTGTDEMVAAAADKSIAVLPFADFSPGGDQAWFADGLTDEILNALARTSDLRVASRTSAFAYKGSDKDVPTIAQELGVAHILEGSVRRGDGRVRVTAQLIRANDDTHLWSETFDGTTDDAIKIQEDIALSIARALQTTMDPDELKRMLASGTRSVEAWELYLRAQQIDRDPFADNATAGAEQLKLLERAVVLDPEFVDAHLRLANLWAAHLGMVNQVRVNIGVDDAEAQQRFHAAIKAASASARSESARLQYELLQARTDVRLTDALAIATRLVELRPGNADAMVGLMEAEFDVGDYAAARETALKASELLRAEGRGEDLAFQALHRIDVPAALTMAERTLAGARANIDLYQTHRVFLYAGLVERAAQVAEEYYRTDPSIGSRTMVMIRQACAEGRVADANALFDATAGVDGDSMRQINQWLYLKTLGRDDEAREQLRQFDNPAGAYALSSYLVYTTFDPNDYPYLAKRLAEQGIKRPPATKIPFACKR